MELRGVLAGLRVRSPAALMQELRRPTSPLRSLLALVLGVRVYERIRARHTMEAALMELASSRPRRWVLTAVRQCFAVYCALRRAAVPLARRGSTDVCCVV